MADELREAFAELKEEPLAGFVLIRCHVQIEVA